MLLAEYTVQSYTPITATITATTKTVTSEVFCVSEHTEMKCKK